MKNTNKIRIEFVKKDAPKKETREYTKKDFLKKTENGCIQKAIICSWEESLGIKMDDKKQKTPKIWFCVVFYRKVYQTIQTEKILGK